jgi:hypothetical protein
VKLFPDPGGWRDAAGAAEALFVAIPRMSFACRTHENGIHFHALETQKRIMGVL